MTRIWRIFKDLFLSVLIRLISVIRVPSNTELVPITIAMKWTWRMFTDQFLCFRSNFKCKISIRECLFDQRHQRSLMIVTQESFDYLQTFILLFKHPHVTYSF
jgi:hypothetical protein